MSSLLLDSEDVDYVDDEYSAARLLLELQAQLAEPGLPTGKRNDTTAAINKLKRTWPEAHNLAAEASDDELGRLTPRLKRTRDQHRKNSGVTASKAAAARTKRQRDQHAPHPKSSAAPKPAGQPKPVRLAPAPAPRRASSKRGAGAGLMPGVPPIPGVTAAKSMTLQLVGLGLGLSFAYLLLTDAERPGPGGAIVSRAILGLSTLVTALAGPGDPLQARAAGTTAKAANRPASPAAKTAAGFTAGAVAGAVASPRPTSRRHR